MNIGLIGYGKMGREIERLALERGHSIAGRIDYHNRDELTSWTPDHTDVAIEFTAPELAFENIKSCLSLGIPVVSGTTGWLEHKQEIDDFCVKEGGTFFYASNFSLGVNITFKVNQFLARIMNKFHDFTVSMEEIHHTEKKDAPSGTALTLAQDIINNIDRIEHWSKENDNNPQQLPIQSIRKGKVPGTHTVCYRSPYDHLTLSHEALNRTGFALGAVLVAEWIERRQGVLSMDDFLEL